MQVDPSLIAQLQKEILSWYEHEARDLPWRRTRDPYSIMVSELMLQQTQVPRVIEKYLVWLELFPSVSILAKSAPSKVIQAWSGLGYNRRALYLQRAAQSLSELGNFPQEYDQLIKLPGIGPYTAAAICSFAYNQDVALIDTNIKRIYQLIVTGDQPTVKDKDFLTIAEQFLPLGRSREWHNALMDIGTILAKERGAQKQQQQLTKLFPILNQFPLPFVSSEPLKRSKQSPFKHSKRYWRGQVIQMLRTQSHLTTATVKEFLTLPAEASYTYQDIINSLVGDGLIVKDGDMIKLPE
jgi:A/G-specific adenine glycosylase